MLKIYDPSNVSNVIPFPIEDNMRYVTHKYSGYDTLTFEMANNDPLYKYVVEETKIEDEKNRYIVKKVDEHSDFVTVVCYVDLDDWKVNVFEEFRTTNKMLSEVLALLLPGGWTVVGAGQFSKRTTVEEMEGQPFKGANPVDILPAVAEAYSCTFQFNAINKTIEAIDPATFKPSGQFFTDELNLKSLGFVGDSTSFATRLYAFGKKDEDGNALTFASINDGKPYVEDHSYSDKIISVGWSDERYTNKENLLADAKAKLQELSYPVRSYTCDADKLGDGTWLYQIVTLIDRRRRTRVNHQVVEYKECPNHVGDSVTLSMVAPRIESYVGKVESDLKNQIKNESYTIRQELDKAIEFATQQITGNKGGHFMWVFDSQDRPIELLNLGDTDDISTAKQVWRWNASGLGHSNDGYNGTYTLALLADGSINASAISTGIMTANLIRAGKIADLAGANYWDLETGEFSLTMGAKVKDAGGKVVTLGDVLKDVELTQENVFNALTNNGANKGIYMTGGELYINASYIATGTLADVNKNTVFDLSTGALTMKKGSININDRFTVDQHGYLTAQSVELSGSFRSISGSTFTELDEGILRAGYTSGSYDTVHGILDCSAQYVSSSGSSGYNCVVLKAMEGSLILGAYDTIYFTDETGSGTARAWVRSDGLHSKGGLSVSSIAIPTGFDNEGKAVSWYNASLVDGIIK